MEFELNAWLDELGLTGDDRAAAARLFEPSERQNKLKGSVMRQADYSRHLNDLSGKEADLQKRLDQAEADIDAERGTLTTWRTNAEGKLTTAQQRADELERQLFDTQQKMRKVATDNGIDLADLELEPVTPAKKTDDKSVTRTTDDGVDTLRKEVGASLIGAARLPAVLMRLNAEHRKLFGDDIPDPEKLVDEVLTAADKGKRVNIVELWERTYDVPKKRETLAAADFDRRVNEQVDVKLRERLENQELGVKNPGDHPGSPILTKFGTGKTDQQQHQDNRPRHNGETGADAARRAFRSGKHREEAQRLSRAALAG